VPSRAVSAQSLVRRFERWRQNQRIAVHQWSGPLIQHALAAWGTNALYLALDTSTLGETYGLVRMSRIARGRALPLVWKVLQHPRRRVAYTVYAAFVDTAASRLPLQGQVIFVADRGVADTHLMEHLRRLAWHWRIRFKSRVWISRCGPQPGKTSRLSLALGEARCWPHVSRTKIHDGPGHLALARRQDGKEEWVVVSDEPTDRKTFEE